MAVVADLGKDAQHLLTGHALIIFTARQHQQPARIHRPRTHNHMITGLTEVTGRAVRFARQKNANKVGAVCGNNDINKGLSLRAGNILQVSDGTDKILFKSSRIRASADKNAAAVQLSCKAGALTVHIADMRQAHPCGNSKLHLRHQRYAACRISLKMKVIRG